MICKNCGAIITVGLTECEFCGSAIDTSNLSTESTTTQNFVSLLSFDEKQQLSFYIMNGDLAKAQRFVMNTFGFNGTQAYEIVNQIIKHKDAAIPNLTQLRNIITRKSQNVLFFDDTDQNMLKAKIGAQNKYLIKQGYIESDKILLLYDNAILNSGESGFTITTKNFYSSGSLFGNKAFFLPLHEIKTTQVKGSTLLINEKKVDIALIDANDYLNVCAIVSTIIRSNR